MAGSVRESPAPRLQPRKLHARVALPVNLYIMVKLSSEEAAVKEVIMLSSAENEKHGDGSLPPAFDGSSEATTWTKEEEKRLVRK